MTASAGPVLKQLYEEFGDRIGFLTLYVREAHPGDRYPQPQTFDDKLKLAREYKHRDRIPWPVVVDDIDGRLHRALDSKPNAAYLVDIDGRIAQRVLWSNDERGLRRAVRALLEHRAPGQHESRLIPTLAGLGCMYPVLENAGQKALDDLQGEVPPVYLMARTANLFKPLPPLGRSIAAGATLLASAALVIVAAQRAVTRKSRA